MSAPGSGELDSLAWHVNAAFDRVSQLRRIASAPNGFSSSLTIKDLAMVGRRYLKFRRDRDDAFSPGMFADPAWDLMLDLFVSQVEGRRISVSSACMAAAVPNTTGLRWIGRLEKESLVVRSDDPQDRRRVFVTLTPYGLDLMADWLRRFSQLMER